MLNRLSLAITLSWMMLCALTAPVVAAGPTTLPSVFADHMVLQREIPVPVWGRAEPGMVVTVTSGEISMIATADASGNWRVDLPPMRASTTPIELEVTDSAGTSITFRDVLVGDVWVASGQSNMEWPLRKSYGAEEEIAQANHPAIRSFIVRRRGQPQPQFDCQGAWHICSPQTAGGFSGVAYYFAKELQKDQAVPIGIIGTYAGGTKIESWMSLDGFAAAPALREFVEEIEQIKANLPALQAKYENETLPAWQKAHDEWEREFGAAHREAMKQWTEASAQARAAGQPAPRRPQPEKPQPRRPDPPNTNPRGLSSLYNGMVAPIVPFAIKGVIWYQGESNADRPLRYRDLFPAMIADWRRQWNQRGNAGSLTRDFPFLYVQLANFRAFPDTDWPALREAQAMALDASPNTAMVAAIDVGAVDDIHPKDKRTVGHRLSLAAKHIAYGRKDVIYNGPTFDSMEVRDGEIHVKFTDVGGGLVTRMPPTTQPQPGVPQPTTVAEFKIAGDDGRFVPAAARITAPDTIVVSSEQVPRPAHVRYAWDNMPEVNLYNTEGLPAFPFRTDDLPVGPATREAPR